MLADRSDAVLAERVYALEDAIRTKERVRLRDVARIELGALQYASTAFFGDDPTVVLAVFQMPGSNALALQKAVSTKMEELSKRFPKGLRCCAA